MLAKCANPRCENRFRYLREGKLFSFRALPLNNQVTRSYETEEHWWLCSQCAEILTIRFEPGTGVRVVPKTKFERGECTHVGSLYQAGLVESYCNRCGRFVAASRSAAPLNVAEETHHCVTITDLNRGKGPQPDHKLPNKVWHVG